MHYLVKDKYGNAIRICSTKEEAQKAASWFTEQTGEIFTIDAVEKIT